MSVTYNDFVEDAVIMLERPTPATDTEIIKYLNDNDVYTHAPHILRDAKAIVLDNQTEAK